MSRNSSTYRHLPSSEFGTEYISSGSDKVVLLKIQIKLQKSTLTACCICENFYLVCTENLIVRIGKTYFKSETNSLYSMFTWILGIIVIYQNVWFSSVTN